MSRGIQIINTEISNLTVDEFLTDLQSGIVFTPNVDHLVRLHKDRNFYETYKIADYKLCDSRIIYFLSFFLRERFKAHITGSSVFGQFCRFHSENKRIKIFCLGGRTQEVADIAKRKINSECRRSIIVEAYSPPFGFEKDQELLDKIVEEINKSDANVLAVGVGSPKQEYLIKKLVPLLHKIDIYFAIGATIDFESGKIKRSPKAFTRLGLEWLYRFLKEPKRLARRYFIDDPIIFILFIKQMMGLYKDPWK